MFNKLKVLLTNQGFICKNPNEKKRIWQKLTDAGYPMFFRPELDHQLTIVFIEGKFCNFGGVGELLDEAEFFGENEWTPKAGEWVEALIYNVWEPHLFVVYWDEKYWIKRNDIYELHPCSKIRQIKPETITLQEAQEKLRELLNKPNLTIEP